MLSTDWSYPQIAGQYRDLPNFLKGAAEHSTNFGKSGTRHLIAMNLYG
jgi:hypothetical protein